MNLNLAEKLDQHFNISGKYPEKGIDFMVGIRAIMCGEYKGKLVTIAQEHDAKRLGMALLQGDIYTINSINQKYTKAWNRNQIITNSRYVKRELVACEIFTKTLKILCVIDNLLNAS